jgi:hypothetical protein
MPSHSYKGSSSPPGKLSLWAAPVATNPSTGVMSWTTSSGSPPFWTTYYSTGGSSGPWVEGGNIAGTLRTQTLTTGSYYYIQGVAADNSPVTQPSNAVLVN